MAAKGHFLAAGARDFWACKTRRMAIAKARASVDGRDSTISGPSQGGHWLDIRTALGGGGLGGSKPVARPSPLRTSAMRACCTGAARRSLLPQAPAAWPALLDTCPMLLR
ncbi:hypothetical protein H4R24_004586 [Coemansia sp. RSA 988]|nr:hypothetical protein H4R24_004586 [Coemansia sp. RSA 988]